MTERVASGEVHLGLDAADVTRGLERIEREFTAAMRDIGAQEAKAKIDAELAPLEDKLAKAKRKVRELEGQKATVRADANTKELDRQLKNARRAVKRLDGQKAVVEVKLKGVEKALAAEKALQDADDKRARAASANSDKLEALERRRMAAINRRARVISSLNRQQEREMMRAHSEAVAMDRERERSAKAEVQRRRQAVLGTIEEQRGVIRLQQEYKRLSDRLERLSKKREFNREARVKLELDKRGLILDMERVKAELQLLADHPPIEFEPKIKRRGLDRVKGQFTDLLQNIATKAAGLGDITTRLGPFSGSIKQFALALSFLGPTITDIVGAAGSLVGVLGAGIAGAAGVGAAGIIGMITGFGGLALSMQGVAADFKLAQQVTVAYTKAVDKYGASSSQAKTAQDQMNSVLAHVSPVARNAAVGLTRFQTQWTKLTQPTQRSAGNIVGGFFKSLNTIAPRWAAMTNDLSNRLDHSLRGGFRFLRSPEFARDFSTIGQNFNRSLGPMMHAIGSFGRALLSFAREGSNFLTPMAQAIDNFANSVLRFTQRDDFGATVARWAKDAGDIIRFFGAATRVVTHFFGIGSRAGDGFVNTMTNALSRWDKFIQSAQGQRRFGDWFQHSVHGVQALYAALQPVVQLFAAWAAGLEPAVTAATRVFSIFTKLAGALGHLVGLNSGARTLAATLGAMWAVGKIGGFVATLSRIPGILGDIRKTSGVLGVFKALGNGDFLRGLRGGGGLGSSVEAGGAAAGRTIAASMEAAGAAVAGEIRAAMISGGAAGAVERGVAGAAGGAAAGAGAAAAGAEAAAGAGAAATAAAGGAEAVGAVGAASVGAAAGVGLLTGALELMAYKVITTKSPMDKLRDSIIQGQTAAAQSSDAYHTLIGSYGDVSTAIKGAHDALKAANKEVKDTKPGTESHRRALENQRVAQDYVTQSTKHWTDQVKQAQRAANDQVALDQRNLTGTHKLLDAQIAHNRAVLKDPRRKPEWAATQAVLNTQLAKEAELTTKLNSDQNVAAASAAQMARVYAGLRPVAKGAEQAIGALARAAGKKMSIAVATKFTGSGDVAKVANAARAAAQSGTKQSVVMRIVADSKNAEQAIRRLNSATLDTKKLSIVEHGGQAALKVVQDLIGKKLTPKQQQILSSGGPAALGLLRSIIGMRLPNKSFDIKANDYVSGVVAHLNQLTLTPKYQDIYARVHSAGGSGQMHGGAAQHATGGAMGVAGVAAGHQTRASQAKALSKVASGNARTMSSDAVSRGGKVSGVRAVIGEEPSKPEFVISTNPAYKKSNVKYLGMAARALGVKMAAMGSFTPSSVQVPGITGGAAEFHPSAKLPRKPKPLRKKQRHPYTTKRGWGSYIANLHTQQDYWEREVGIRESQIQEPADMVIEDPANTKTIKDPITGEETVVKAYMPNPEIERTYKPSIQAVMDAIQQLLKIIQELVRAIPLAQNAASQEIAARSGSVHTAETELHKENRRWDGLPKDRKSDSGEQNRHNNTVNKLKKTISDEKDQIKNLKDDNKTLSADRVEAGFDFREQLVNWGNYKKEFDSAAGNAQADANQQNTDAASNGAGGGGGDAGATTGIYYANADTATADAAKMDVFRQFAGNMQAAATFATQMTTTVGGAGASSGGQVNAGSMQPVTTGTVATGQAAAGAIAAAPSAASSAVSSGRAAGAVVAGGSGGVAAPSMGAAAAPSATTQNIYVQPTFAQVPPDPMPFARGVAFEIAGAL